MVVVIDSSTPGRVAHLRRAWRKCLTMTIRPACTIALIGLSETNTIGYVKSIRTTPIFNPRLPAQERPSPEFHHPVNGRDVGAERGTPGLKTLGLVHAASPPAHQVQHLHDLLRGRPGLMGRMHVDLQVGHQVPLGHTGYHNE